MESQTKVGSQLLHIHSHVRLVSDDHPGVKGAWISVTIVSDISVVPWIVIATTGNECSGDRGG
ncbi:hypothetical protein J7438_16860 [Thalassotalea sp. G20_0]|uniref:hypothetical protein n=1 Tax=Thalassotalea sp. G20_0 TaxID=2821093 RepID=UPI001ADBE4C8|nr:hypothetical protein [Thalassotalea sp. G20_0]MBO9495746.1 hypothetical protein [Thalassotalea sp. G20_0]